MSLLLLFDVMKKDLFLNYLHVYSVEFVLNNWKKSFDRADWGGEGGEEGGEEGSCQGGGQEGGQQVKKRRREMSSFLGASYEPRINFSSTVDGQIVWNT